MKTPDIQEVNVKLEKQSVTFVRKLDILKIHKSASIDAAIPKHDCLQYDNDYYCAAVASANSPFQVTSTVLINDTYKAEALIDSACTHKSFISKQICNLLNLKITLSTSTVEMASAALIYSIPQIL